MDRSNNLISASDSYQEEYYGLEQESTRKALNRLLRLLGLEAEGEFSIHETPIVDVVANRFWKSNLSVACLVLDWRTPHRNFHFVPGLFASSYPTSPPLRLESDAWATASYFISVLLANS